MLAQGGYAALRKHKWFRGFDWAALKAGKLPAPWMPPWDPDSGLPNPAPPVKKKKTGTAAEAMTGACDVLKNLTAADGRQLAWIFTNLPDKKLYPDYYEVIKTPVSLKRIQKKVESSKYPSWDAFQQDVVLMFQNARVYNLPDSQVCLDAAALEAAFRKYAKTVSASVKSAGKSARAAAQPSPKRGAAAKTKGTQKSQKQKQTVNQLKQSMTKAWEIMCGLTDTNKRARAGIFMDLPAREIYPDYYELIKKPVSLRLLKEKIDNSAYSGWKAFEKDVLLIFDNARKYNLPGSQVCIDAKALEAAYRKFADKVPAQTKKAVTLSLVSVESFAKERKRNLKQMRTEAMMKTCVALCECTDDRGRVLAKNFIEWPDQQLYPNYFTVIKTPMCFRRVKEKIKTASYKSWKSFEKDVLRIFENARKYNLDAQWARDAAALQAEYRQLAGKVSATLTAASTPRNRPKAESRREAMMAACEVLCGRTDANGRVVAGIFMDLPPRELYPDYYDVIKVPMCLRLIQQKIETGAYSRWNSFEEDMLVMFANARQYNLPDSQVCQDAATLEVAYRQYAEKLPASVRSEDMLGAWELLCKATDDSGRAVATEFMELPARELYPDYYKTIKKPVCLRLLKEKVENAAYKSWKTFDKDVMLMISNARKYNLPDSQVCLDAATLENAYQDYTKKLLKAAKAAAPSGVSPRPQPKTEMKSLKQMRAEAMTGAYELLCGLTDDKDRLLCSVFMEWPDREQCPDYYDMIKHPMCLRRIEEKIGAFAYQGWSAFERDVLRMFENARQYNLPESWVCADAAVLEAAFRSYVEKVPAHVRGVTSTSARAAGAASPNGAGSAAADPQYQAEKEAMQATWSFLCSQTDDDGRVLAGFFMELPSKELYPDYYTVIKRPVSLRMIKDKLDCDLYRGFDQFKHDATTIFSNARQYNQPDSQVCKDANALEKALRQRARNFTPAAASADSSPQSEGGVADLVEAAPVSDSEMQSDGGPPGVEETGAAEAAPPGRSRRATTEASSKGTVGLQRQRRMQEDLRGAAASDGRSRADSSKRKRDDEDASPEQQKKARSDGGDATGETVSVQRDDGDTKTMLRNRATASSRDDVWVESEACVSNGEIVTVLSRARGFARILTAEGEEGWIKARFICKTGAAEDDDPAEDSGQESPAGPARKRAANGRGFGGAAKRQRGEGQAPGGEAATVLRNDGSDTTMLRNRPTAASDKTVWLDSRACVDEGETVAVEERVRAFARVRTASGETGWIKSQYLVKPAASPKSAYKCRVCGLPKKGHTCPGVWQGD